MSESSPPHASPPKDMADLLETVARKIRTDPSWGAGAPAEVDDGGITVYAGPEFAADVPRLGFADVQLDSDAVTVTLETKNIDANAVKVTLAEDKLFIGIGDGLKKDIQLPRIVDEEAAVATFRNGILDIVLPLRRK